MRESTADLWEMFGHPGHRIAISTNGFVKRNGEAVMGRGCAKQAKDLWIDAPARLGTYIRSNGNVPGYLFINGGEGPSADRLMILPVKHNWWERADETLVHNSIAFLMHEAHAWPDWTFHVPRLGCGNGKLSWEGLVRPWMAVLPDTVIVHGGKRA